MEWIKVETELPKEGDDVLLRGKDGYEIYQNYRREHFVCYYEDVTHWAHLESPMKEDVRG